jgi:hypothetical protein
VIPAAGQTRKCQYIQSTNLMKHENATHKMLHVACTLLKNKAHSEQYPVSV